MPSSSSASPSQTLFKSSLRPTSRNRPGPSSTAGSNADQWPPSMNASHLDPSQWTYLAEGGKNLLLRFDGDLQAGKEAGWVNANGSRALALRVVKSERGQEGVSSTAQGPADSLPPRPDFEASVIAPLLGKKHLLPPTARISLEGGEKSPFLEKVAARIELARPAERRRFAGVDLKAGFVDVVEDLTWAAPGDEVLAVEIKPKWLFPTGKHSRYKKHRVLKSQGQLTLEQWNALYDPLDLVSGDAERIHKATEALVQDWEGGGNNLRVFLGGQAVRDAKSKDFQRLLSRLHPQPTSDQSSSSLLLAGLLKDILSTSDAQAVLKRLAHLQSSLAPLDINTLSTWWKAQTGGQELGQEEGDSSSSPALSSPPSLQEYREFANDWLQIQPNSDGDSDDAQQESAAASSLALTLRQAVLGTLLSATFKDCSLFLRLGPEQEDMNPSSSATAPSNSDAGAGAGQAPKQELQTQSLTSVTENSSSSSTSASLTASLSASTSALLGGSSSYVDPKLVAPHVGERNAPRNDTGHSGQQEIKSAATAVGHTLRIIDVDAKPMRKLGYWLELEGQLEEAFELWRNRVGLPGKE